ncbi:hypothetical protein DYB32_003830 [Aphanomyces invadans]|uniref:subtilisin n=1 Tax=Aphanomyces invadans TaxID=157072 RepID=A0A418AZH5_9STRA|nr:hypothetical protein DYB32_003830 [Aphanomyces invadans]
MKAAAIVALLAALVTGHAMDLPTSKIDPVVASYVQNASTVPSVVVEFAATPAFDASALARLPRPDRLATITTLLETTARQSQGGVLELILDALTNDPSLQAQSYYISNRIFLSHASASLVLAIAADPAVSLVRTAIPDGQLLGFVTSPIQNDATSAGNLVAWPIERIKAPSAWQRGVRGANVVVGTIDSGVRHTHKSLNSTYRSDHGWFDATGGASPSPIDYSGHGTAVTAAAVGGAPAATWMACAACQNGRCTERAMTACAQFMLCPSSVEGSTAECGLAPHVIVNGWHTDAASWFTPVLVAWKVGGIVPVFGSGVTQQLVDGVSPRQCSTVAGPASSDLALAAVPTNVDDSVTEFGRFGPAQEYRVKPDIAAPGNAVRTADASADDAYIVRSGASLAAGYTGGAVALYLSAFPHATFEDIFVALTTSAARTKSVGLRCGGLPDDSFPNNVAGAGRLDISLALGVVSAPPNNLMSAKVPTATTTTDSPSVLVGITTNAPSNGTHDRNATAAPTDTIAFANSET